MHVTASLAFGASEQDETCNAVLLDDATYVCYASRVPAPNNLACVPNNLA